ncbi:MAG: lysophospholipid acyltransferase family protein [Blastochloris sp.]|nr:lysophospholipid acyltransferase family protein [Blastochloris sp.]
MSLWYQCVRNLAKSYFDLFYDVRVSGLENLPPENTGFIIASNHISFYDPPLIGSQIPRDVYYLARKTLFDPPIMALLLPSILALPVDQEKPDMVGLKKIIQTLRDNKPVILFPEGSRSYDGEFLPGLPGVGLLVNKTLVPVIPVRLFGAREVWPRDGKIKWFKPVEIVYGKAIHFPASKDYQATSNSIMEAIGQLRPAG